MLRDIFFGLLSYVLSIGALVATMLLCIYLFGPPTADRARTFAFIGGGGLLLFTSMLVSIAGVMIYSAATRH